MGSSYSYLKIRTSKEKLVGVLAFYHQDQYRQFTICTHPDNQFNQSSTISYNRYYDLGDWYYYDGNREKLYNILRDFNPKNQSLTYLIARLEAECALSKYESVCTVLKRWAVNTANFCKSGMLPLISFGVRYLMGCSESKPPGLPGPC